MKLFLTTITLFCTVLFSAKPSLKEIRSHYATAVKDAAVAEELYQSLTEVSTEDTPILYAYKGGVSAIMARHVKGLKNKKDHFKEGATLIEKAIADSPDNLEIRCIRLGVQENSPKLLKYKGNIDEDKAFVLKHYANEKSAAVKAVIQDFVLQSSLFSDEEKAKFK